MRTLLITLLSIFIAFAANAKGGGGHCFFHCSTAHVHTGTVIHPTSNSDDKKKDDNKTNTTKK
ncbi:MAG TPA: hypothetical protein VN922_13075 [Bacteroidia bacterium]|nr:hypothetical protein [Bacteroidia bacterium]